MRVLVAVASKHGATREIAESLGRALAERGVNVEVRALDEVVDLSGYDAVVLGSAVYMGRWLEPARAFVDAHADELAGRPTWLFISGPIGYPPKPYPGKAVELDALLDKVRPREHKLFAGKVDTSKLSFPERTAMRAVRARAGDDRDWEAIEAWAASIATALEHETVA